MPIYEYHCQKCKKDHEIIQKFSDKPLKTCPACGGKMAKKLSLSGFHLKGGGWYKDGYSSTPSTKKESSGSSPCGDATTSTKCDSKGSCATDKKK